MPKPPLPAAIQEMLARPNPSVMSTLRSDGHPVSVATWYLWENDHVVVNFDCERVRIKHLQRDPRTTITVLAGEDWYTTISIQGRVIGWDEDADLAQIDRISRHYTGADYPVRDRPRVGARIKVLQWTPTRAPGAGTQ